MAGFREIPRRFAVHFATHFGGMGDIISPNAENTPHGIALIRPNNW
jgi:hypothetical protein